MKIVGIISRSQNINNKEFIGCYINYVKKIKECNAFAIIIPNIGNIDYLLDICDGILSPGGDDITESDIKIYNYALINNKPYLGICLGMQVMGDSLTKTNNHYLKNHYIYLNKNSLLYKIYKCDKIKVNSRHKEKVIKTSNIVSAKALDGTIEALEVKNKKFILGVQWHPEDLSDISLFKSFIDSL